MSNLVMIDEREALDVLDLMRTAIPDEIKQARRITQEREKILAQAQSESQRLLAQTQDRVERMSSQDAIVLAAQQRARELLEQAQLDAEEVRRGADEYAADLLERLNREVRRIQGSVENALQALLEQPAYEEEEEEYEE